MTKNLHLGKFIVIEGLDGSGQSTQIELLQDFLTREGYQVISTKEPTRDSEAGKKIRQVLTKLIELSPKSLQELFAEDRKEHLEKVVIPALKDGKMVISDRYFFTSFAYGMAEGVDLEYLIKINDKFLLPDLTIILRVSAEVCLKRIEERGRGKEFFERKNHFQRALKNFEEFTNRFENVYIINGERPIEEVFEDIKNLVHSKLNL